MQYTISGIVVKGDQYGRTLGFPTMNLETTEAMPMGLNFGVYVGMAVIDEKEYRAGILINPNGKIEAHLIGYSGDAYGKKVTLELKKFIREFKKFDTEEELIIQITKDIETCKTIVF
jgi:riboflavin kinase/FMN adenylyltransferase